MNDFRFLEVTNNGVPEIWIGYVAPDGALKGWVVSLPTARMLANALLRVVEQAEQRACDAPGTGVTVRKEE